MWLLPLPTCRVSSPFYLSSWKHVYVQRLFFIQNGCVKKGTFSLALFIRNKQNRSLYKQNLHDFTMISVMQNSKKVFRARNNTTNNNNGPKNLWIDKTQSKDKNRRVSWAAIYALYTILREIPYKEFDNYANNHDLWK